MSYGRPEHVAAESMGRYRGYWWAPDGQRLLVARVDEAPVQQWYRGRPGGTGPAPGGLPLSPGRLRERRGQPVDCRPDRRPGRAAHRGRLGQRRAGVPDRRGMGRGRALRRRAAPRPAGAPGARHRRRHGRDPGAGHAARRRMGSPRPRAARPDLLRRAADQRRHQRHPPADGRRPAGHPARPAARRGARGQRRDRAVHRVRRADADACVGLRPRGRAAPPERGAWGASRDRAGGHRRPGLAHAGPARPADHRAADPRPGRGGDAGPLGG